MPIVKIVQNDMIKTFKEDKLDAIAHGCNTQNLMGAGIAKFLSDSFPSLLFVDKKFHDRFTETSNHDPVPLMAGNLSVLNTDHGDIYNLYTQIKTGSDATYQNLLTALQNLNKFCKQRGQVRVGLPLIGAGIGGLEVMAVLSLIHSATPDIDVYLFVLPNYKNLKKIIKEYNSFSKPRVFSGLIILDSITKQKKLITEYNGDYTDISFSENPNAMVARDNTGAWILLDSYSTNIYRVIFNPKNDILESDFSDIR